MKRESEENVKEGRRKYKGQRRTRKRSLKEFVEGERKAMERK